MQAERVRVSPAGWTVETTSGERLTASGVVLTAPVPLSLALLDSGQVALPPLSRAALEMITYEPCLAVMLLLSGPGRVPEPGGLWPLGEPVAWVADNYRKGVSGVWGAITVHAGPEFSQTYWTADDEVIASHLVDATREWLGDDEVLTFRVHRWRYSRPARTHPEPILGVSGPEPLVFAGDAFAGPRIEGAALSGLAAADWLLR
jgi:renalase